MATRDGAAPVCVVVVAVVVVCDDASMFWVLQKAF